MRAPAPPRPHVPAGCGRWLLLAACLLATGPALAAAPAICDGAQRIRLRTPVQVSPAELSQWRAMAPLRVTSVTAPPLSMYDATRHSYQGISMDVLCFITQQLGLRYEVVPTGELPVEKKLALVQQGSLDVFTPLSLVPERQGKGLFTAPFYSSYYVAIARKGQQLALARDSDLAHWRVGAITGSSIVPALQSLVPESQLRTYDEATTAEGLFQQLRGGAIDVAVFNLNFFLQERYRHELFDLEIVLRLSDFPREYRFYFSPSPHHERLVAAFDRYLGAIDIADSLQAHESGERQLIDRYVAQRSQGLLLQAIAVVSLLVALASYAALRRYRRLSRAVTQSRERILAQQEQLRAANEELERRSQTDGLTRLANRRHFDHSLARELARQQRTGAALSLLLIDVDHFKAVNDRWGHPIGDDYLRAVARVLASQAARSSDLAARYGGEEFACLLPETDAESAALVAERIRARVAELDLPGGLPGASPVTVSIGVATASGPGHDATALLTQADEQLYAAKHAGRNRVRSTVLPAA